MKGIEGSRLWEKVAAGFLGLFAIREAGKIASSIVSAFVFLCLLGCLGIYLLLN